MYVQPMHLRDTQYKLSLHIPNAPVEADDSMTCALYETHGNAKEAPHFHPRGNPGPCILLKSTGPPLWAASPLDVRSHARCPYKSQSQSGPQAAPPDPGGQPG